MYLLNGEKSYLKDNFEQYKETNFMGWLNLESAAKILRDAIASEHPLFFVAITGEMTYGFRRLDEIMFFLNAQMSVAVSNIDKNHIILVFLTTNKLVRNLLMKISKKWSQEQTEKLDQALVIVLKLNDSIQELLAGKFVIYHIFL